jgi:hypothetical protein
MILSKEIRKVEKKTLFCTVKKKDEERESELRKRVPRRTLETPFTVKLKLEFNND